MFLFRISGIGGIRHGGHIGSLFPPTFMLPGSEVLAPHQQAMSSYCKISSTNFITTDKIWTRSEISDTNYMNTLIQQHLRSINIMGLQYKKFCSWHSDGTSIVYRTSILLRQILYPWYSYEYLSLQVLRTGILY